MTGGNWSRCCHQRCAGRHTTPRPHAKRYIQDAFLFLIAHIYVLQQWHMPRIARLQTSAEFQYSGWKCVPKPKNSQNHNSNFAHIYYTPPC